MNLNTKLKPEIVAGATMLMVFHFDRAHAQIQAEMIGALFDRADRSQSVAEIQGLRDDDGCACGHDRFDFRNCS